MSSINKCVPPSNVTAYSNRELRVQRPSGIVHLYLQIRMTAAERRLKLVIWNTVVRGVPVSLAVSEEHQDRHGEVHWGDFQFTAFVRQQWEILHTDGSDLTVTINSGTFTYQPSLWSLSVDTTIDTAPNSSRG